jgi:hypothetical protein
MNMNIPQCAELRKPKLQESVANLERIAESLGIVSGNLLERLVLVSMPQPNVSQKVEGSKSGINPPIINRINTVCQSLEMCHSAIQDQLDRIEV